MTTPRIRLIIPSYNRPHSLKRLLSFLQDQAFAHPITILDSSEDKQAEDNKATVKQFPTLDLHRIQFPSTTFFYEKLYQGISKSEQKYVALCADDDVIIPQTIEALADLLDTTPDAGFGHGITTRFWEKPDRQAFIDLEYRPISYENSCPLARIQKLCSCVESTIWSVYRPKILTTALNAARQTDAYFFGEMLTMTFTLAQAKAVALPLPLNHRSCEPFAETPNNWHPVFWILRDQDDFRKHYSTFHSSLANFLEDTLKIEIDRNQIDRNQIDAFLHISFIDLLAPQWCHAKGKTTETLNELRGIAPLPKVENLKMFQPKRESTLTYFLKQTEARLRKLVPYLKSDASRYNSEFNCSNHRFITSPRLNPQLKTADLRQMCAQLSSYLKTNH